MASALAIEECTHIFSSPCENLFCLHAESSTLTAAEAMLDSVPDALSRRPKGMTYLRLMKCSDGEARHIVEWDKYVMTTQFHISRDKNGEVRASVSDEPVLISDLRPAEQNAAYGALLARAPEAKKVREYHRLHVRRLDGIRDEIILSEGEKQRCHGVFMRECKERKLGRREMDVGGERVERACVDWKMAEKEVERWRARERAVMRLVERCEELGL